MRNNLTSYHFFYRIMSMQVTILLPTILQIISVRWQRIITLRRLISWIIANIPVSNCHYVYWNLFSSLRLIVLFHVSKTQNRAGLSCKLNDDRFKFSFFALATDLEERQRFVREYLESSGLFSTFLIVWNCTCYLERKFIFEYT